jgi:c-di-AMP phosphodiesterase-like protein
MFYEVTSDDFQTGFYYIQDTFANSSLDKNNLSSILKKWLLNIKNKDYKKSTFYIPNIKYIIDMDFSSSICTSYDVENDTTLSEEYYRKTEQIKALEDVAGILNDLTPEQINIFEEAVKRRPLFK